MDELKLDEQLAAYENELKHVMIPRVLISRA